MVIEGECDQISLHTRQNSFGTNANVFAAEVCVRKEPGILHEVQKRHK